MKRTVLIGAALMAVLFASTAAFAADYALGLRFWANNWTETVSPQVGTSQDYDNGSVLMAGPSLNVRLQNNWFADATYLTTPFGDYESSGWLATGDTMKFNRTDLDLMVGRMFQPFSIIHFGVVAAYKMIDAPGSYTNAGAGLTNFNIGTWRLKGPGIGLPADIPLNTTTKLYGNLAFYYLKQEFKFLNGGGTGQFKTDGMVFELGVAKTYRPALTADVGIKYMQFSGTEPTGDSDRDTFFGLTAGVMYTF